MIKRHKKEKDKGPVKGESARGDIRGDISNRGARARFSLPPATLSPQNGSKRG